MATAARAGVSLHRARKWTHKSPDAIVRAQLMNSQEKWQDQTLLPLDETEDSWTGHYQLGHKRKRH